MDASTLIHTHVSTHIFTSHLSPTLKSHLDKKIKKIHTSYEFRTATILGSVLQCAACVAVCCSVLQCVVVCCSVLFLQQSRANPRKSREDSESSPTRVYRSDCATETVCCSVLQCVEKDAGNIDEEHVIARKDSKCLGERQYKCVAVCCSELQIEECIAVCCSVVQCGAAWCSVGQCVAVCCSELECVAVCCRLRSPDLIHGI